MTYSDEGETQPLYLEIGLMEDYEYPPYSFIDSPELVAVHQLMLAHCAYMDDLAILGWLSDLDQT